MIRPRASLLAHALSFALVGVGLAIAGGTGCSMLPERGRPLVPTRHQVRTGPFLVFSNFPLGEESEAIRSLVALERDFQERLGRPPSSAPRPVEIYVLDDHEAFTHFLKFYYPELPPRRAFFLARDQIRLVYTYSSPRLEEDLRHEATHALLHGAYGDLPLWLDEGLAEYFETDLAQPTLVRERAVRLLDDLAAGWTPSLTRLETLVDIHQMTPRDYREAWAWVHLFLDGPPESRTLFASLIESRSRAGELASLADRLAKNGATNERMRDHVQALRTSLDAAVAKPEPTSWLPSFLRR